MPEAPRLLIAEDDHLTRQSLALFFVSSGYQVETASSGQAGLALLEQLHGAAPLDVVLTDIALGDISGIALLAAARALPAPPEVILMTGFGAVETAVAALRGGAYDYLLKPCDLAQLHATVERAVAHRRRLREQERAIQALVAGVRALQQLDGGAGEGPAAEGEAGAPREPPLIQLGPLQINRFTRTVRFGGQQAHLTPTEYSILLSLAEAPQRVHTYGELVQRSYGHEVQEHHARALLKGHIHNLRTKLRPGLIRAVRGVGYMLIPPLD